MNPQKELKNLKTYQKRIGSTVYNVEVHFDESSKESFDEKILRLLKNDLTLFSKSSIIKLSQTDGLQVHKCTERSS